MTTIYTFLSADHDRCDQAFIETESLAAKGDFSAARIAYESFCSHVAHHFTMEEEILFTAFEQATGNSAGPTAVMRHEHDQMRQLFGEMEQALARGDGNGFLDASETLLVLMRQHNGKEEQILYPMCDRLLPEGATVLAHMQSVAV